MATNQPNSAENPDDVMRRFLPEMKRLLNIEDLILYLLSENAIGDDDAPKLTVSGQLSKNQVLVNLQQIISTRGAIEQFLRALERSSDDHMGHKELYDTMVTERQHRVSVSSQRSSTSRSTTRRINSITSQSRLIPESSSQTAPSSQGTPPVEVVAESGVPMSQTTSVSPSNSPEETASTVSQPRRKANGHRSISNMTTADANQQNKKSFWIGWLFGGLCAIVIVLAALAITAIFYGSLGIRRKDKCGFFDVHVGAFDVSSGGLILLLIILMVLVLILYTSYKIYSEDRCLLIMLVPVVVLAIICILGIVSNVLVSFVSIVKVVYGDYRVWNPHGSNCTSPAFFSGFTYVTIEFVLILVFIIVCVFLLFYCLRQLCQ